VKFEIVHRHEIVGLAELTAALRARARAIRYAAEVARGFHDPKPPEVQKVVKDSARQEIEWWVSEQGWPEERVKHVLVAFERWREKIPGTKEQRAADYEMLSIYGAPLPL